MIRYDFVAHVDGSCKGNGGAGSRTGAGIVLVCTGTGKRKEKAVTLGEGTNNTAELNAVYHALNAIRPEYRAETRITVHTDSQYAIGVLSEGHKVRSNAALINRIWLLSAEFGEVRYAKDKGHSGHVGNERADKLADMAARGLAQEAGRG